MNHGPAALSSVSKQTAIATTLIGLLLLVLPATPASAHVAIADPDGGERLEVGSSYTIRWFDTVTHGPADYDLWYSVSGPQGPWIEIAADLTPAPGADETYSYDWLVPDAPSEQVRIRVRQDNAGTDYEDMSNADLAIVKAAATETVTIEAAQDSTLYEGDGSLANGSGSYLFTGRTQAFSGSQERRALLAFDIAGTLPAGSTITAVSLQLTMSKTVSGVQTVELHRLLESWGEGASDAPAQEGGGTDAQAGDATWMHREFPNTFWSTPGGSFSSTVTATQQIESTGDYSFASTGQMVADAQGWLDDPASNFGWAMVVPSPETGSAKRFNSRENGDTGSRPQLTITYETNLDAPAADFSYSPDSPRVGDVVSFTDLSTGSPTAWLWDFDDGTSSEQQSPTHAFTAAGVFTVSLTVSNDSGNDTTSMAVTVLADEEPELSELILIPAAANAPGSAGSFWVTTADVHNAGSTTASFRFLWLPRGTNNSDPYGSALFTIEPGKVRRFDNLLADVFGASDAAGAVAVLSDLTGLKVMSRTFNQNESGTFGQGLPGVAEGDLIPAGNRVRLLFLTENDAFRSNLGLVNGVDSPIIVEWQLFDSDGASLDTGSVTLPAWGNRQINSVLEDFAPIEAAYADVWTMTSGGAFTCYGSVLDQDSSDGTTVLPQ
jgi:PKD repeat protein